MGRMITYATSCSGIDAWGCAVDPLGWHQLWCSEIEPFPCAVLKHRRPHVPNLGDMLKLRDKIDGRIVPAPDVFVAGTPCQAFSVAGLRNGLNDSRGQLTLEYVRICDAIDAVRRADGKTGGVFVWENVPGALSDNTNAFGCFLAGLVGEDQPLEPGPRPERGRSSEHWRWREKSDCHVPKWSDAGVVVGPLRTVAWRVYDAQYFGLAQRRKRVFVVGCDRATLDPVKVLFESEGMRRDTAPRREKGESHTYPTTPCLRASGIGTDRIGELCGEDPVIAVYENHGQDSRYKSIETSPTISAKAGTGGNNLPLVVHETTGPLMSGGRTAGSATTQDALNGMLVVHGELPDLADTLLSGGGGKTGRQDPLNGVMIPVYSNGTPDLANTLTARMAKGINTTMDEGQAPVASAFAQNQVGDIVERDLIGTLNTNSNASGRNAPLVRTVLGVRRLMPVECERLMGFKDGYTLIPWRKGMAPDSLRYRAIGNSKAVPVCRWIARRIESELRGKQ